MSTKENLRAKFRDVAPLLAFSGGCLSAATDSSFDTTNGPSVAAWCVLGLLLVWLDVEYAVGVHRQPPAPTLPPVWVYYAITVVGCLPALYAVLFDHDKLTLGWWAMAFAPTVAARRRRRMLVQRSGSGSSVSAGRSRGPEAR